MKITMILGVLSGLSGLIFEITLVALSYLESKSETRKKQKAFMVASLIVASLSLLFAILHAIYEARRAKAKYPWGLTEAGTRYFPHPLQTVAFVFVSVDLVLAFLNVFFHLHGKKAEVNYTLFQLLFVVVENLYKYRRLRSNRNDPMEDVPGDVEVVVDVHEDLPSLHDVTLEDLANVPDFAVESDE